MKIAMIGHKRIPGREGGIEVVVEELSTRMVKKGHKVTAYNRKKKSITPLKEIEGVRLVNIPTIENKNLDAVIYSFLATIKALFGGYDILHFHAIGPSAMVFIPKLFKKKTVVTVHGLNYKTPKWKGFGARYLKFAEKMVAKYADAVITLSKEQKNYFMEKYNREAIYIPNGTVVNEYVDCDVLSNWQLKKNGFVLYLSRVVPGKGLENLIDAYKQLETDLPLVIAGGSEYVSDFRERMEQKAEGDDRIHFIGHVGGSVVPALYSNARLFVFPSEAEGMPMCLLEAMSYNTPCLVSDIPENKEIGKKYVDYFEVSNTNDLLEKLRQAIKERKITESRSYVLREYDWDVVVERTLGLYEDICYE